jgi:hypothetical protein
MRGGGCSRSALASSVCAARITRALICDPVLVFRNRGELGPIDGMPPLMGFLHTAVYAVHEIHRLEPFAAFLPETRHPPLPE